MNSPRTCPSLEALKNSVPVFELIHKTLWQGSLWLCSTRLVSTGSEPLRISHEATWPEVSPLTKALLSFGLYSMVRFGQNGFRAMKGLLGFSESPVSSLNIQFYTGLEKPLITDVPDVRIWTRIDRLFEISVAIAYRESGSLIRRPGEMSDGTFHGQRVSVHVNGPRERLLYQRSRVRVVEILFVNIAGVILQDVMLHGL